MASPAPDETARFRRDVEALTGGPPDLIGVAVSGGPDSLALLLLAQAAYPAAVRAATVDHGLRAEAAAEARFVARLCAERGIAHQVLVVRPGSLAGASLQARAREERYRLLGEWLQSLGGSVLATAHHRDDQAETLLMRLARGAGVGGLAGIRPSRPLGPGITLLRPLLGWSKEELVAIVRGAGIDAVDDPSNRSPDHDRSAIRALLAREPLLDPARLAAAAAHLGEAEQALAWAEEREWQARACRDGSSIRIDAAGLPPELVWRLAARAVDRVGGGGDWRRDRLAAALDRLERTRRTTLAGVQIDRRGTDLHFAPAPPRTRR